MSNRFCYGTIRIQTVFAYISAVFAGTLNLKAFWMQGMPVCRGFFLHYFIKRAFKALFVVYKNPGIIRDSKMKLLRRMQYEMEIVRGAES